MVYKNSFFRIKIPLRFSVTLVGFLFCCCLFVFGFSLVQLGMYKEWLGDVIWKRKLDIISLLSSTLCNSVLNNHQWSSIFHTKNWERTQPNEMFLLCTVIWSRKTLKEFLTGLLGHYPSLCMLELHGTPNSKISVYIFHHSSCRIPRHISQIF